MIAKPALPDVALGVLRIVLALLVIGHALQKFAGFPQPSPYGEAHVVTLIGAAGIIEAVTGALLLIGLATRPAAFLLSGTMAAAYFVVHAPRSFYPIINGGELAIMFCFTALVIAANRPDIWSIDHRRAKPAPLRVRSPTKP